MEGCFLFDPKDMIYETHFPGNPVVPGSLIIEAFRQVVRNKALDRFPLQATRFRFIEFVKPGEYQYRIIPSTDSLKCFLFSGNRMLVSGELKS